VPAHPTLSILPALRARARETAGLFPGRRLPFTRAGVEPSRELERIKAIPRHPGYTDEQRELVRSIVTREGVHDSPPGEDLCPSCGCPVRLWDRQANTLLAGLEAKGALGIMAVGGGKTLIAALMPTVLERRAVVLTTASLRGQFLNDLDAYRDHFVVRNDIAVVAYTTLSLADRRDILDELDPDLIVADEVHSLKNTDSARTRRFLRFIRDRSRAKRPVVFVALTGTIAKRSIRDYGRLTTVALREWAPVPRDWPTLIEWSEALDPPTGNGPSRAAGALLDLADPAEADALGELEAARRGFQRRFYSTRGIVNGDAEDNVHAELVIKMVETPKSDAIKRARRTLASTWMRPDGEELTIAAHVAEVDRQLRLGGWYGWVGEPDREWLEARRAYHRELREWLSSHPRNRIDSPLLVARALEKGDLKFDTWGEWKRHKEARPPKTAWYWVDESIAQWCAEYSKREAPCIVFAKHVAFGEHVAELAGIPYFGEGKRAAADIQRERGTRSIVASLGAHGQGRNLQRFSRALLADPPPTGLAWEQALGRMHRPGQTSPRVEYAVVDIFNAELDQAREDASYLASTTGVRQKLRTATFEPLEVKVSSVA
jgi:hypothetical protein